MPLRRALLSRVPLRELELLDVELTNTEFPDNKLTNAGAPKPEPAEPDSPDGGFCRRSPGTSRTRRTGRAARLSARELTEQGIGVVQTAHTDLAAYHRTQWEQTVKSSANASRSCLEPPSKHLLLLRRRLPGRCRPDPRGDGLPLPTGFLCELEPTVEALPAFDPEFLQEHGWRHRYRCMRCGTCALDPLEAAAAVIEAMRSGCGCERWDFYRTDDDDDDPLAEEAEVAPSKRTPASLSASSWR